MPSITVRTPTVGDEAFFSFKEPFNTFISNKFNITVDGIKLKVITILSMRDGIRTDLRDPYTDLYDPAGLSEVDFKVDLHNEVPLISFSFSTPDGVERYIRVPLNYISEFSVGSNVEYLNRLLVVDMGSLPKDFDMDVHYQDIIDFISTRTGVSPSIKDVTVGTVDLLDSEEHELRETVRSNTVSVHKTLSIQLAEAIESRDELLNRLSDLGIVLG